MKKYLYVLLLLIFFSFGVDIFSTTITYGKNEQDQIVSIRFSDNSVHYIIQHDADGNIIEIEDPIHQITLYREFCNGKLVREKFPDDKEISAHYDDKGRLDILRISDLGEVNYIYGKDSLVQIDRKNTSGEISYSHRYQCDKKNSVIKETMIADLGEIIYEIDEANNSYIATSPYSLERVNFDTNNNISQQLYNNRSFTYRYDRFSQLLLESEYDPSHNPSKSIVNDCNELLSYKDVHCEYDDYGNLTIKRTPKGTTSFIYDALDRLIEINSNNTVVSFIYDCFGRRLVKTTTRSGKSSKETYIYHHMNELASFTEEGVVQQLRIPGQTFHKDIVRAIAIETQDAIYAPIYNKQNNITTLIDIDTKEVHRFTIDPFGTNLKSIKPSAMTPWLFASKRYDSDTNLVYFGARYYDPSILRWTTPDPLGMEEGDNLYTFSRNNPLRYIDPNGQFVIFVPLLVWGAEIAIAEGIGWAVLTGTALWAANELTKIDKEKIGWKDLRISPPYDGRDLGNNPKKRPGPGFKWYGDKRGSWHHKSKGHSLRPDFNHTGNVKPHWDYLGPEGRCRINTDGTWTPK